MRRLVIVLIVTSLLAAACGDDSVTAASDGSNSEDVALGAETSDATTGEAQSNNPGSEASAEESKGDGILAQLISGLGRLASIEDGAEDQAEALVVAGCDAWIPADRRGDSDSFNEWIYALFGWGGSGVTTEEIDAAVQSACQAHRHNAVLFLTAVLDDLDLTLDELMGFVGTACDGYRNGRRLNIDDPYAPGPIGEKVAAVLAQADINRSRAQNLVDDYCSVFGPDFPAFHPSGLTCYGMLAAHGEYEAGMVDSGFGFASIEAAIDNWWTRGAGGYRDDQDLFTVTIESPRALFANDNGHVQIIMTLVELEGGWLIDHLDQCVDG